jgi:hypothetical protein
VPSQIFPLFFILSPSIGISLSWDWPLWLFGSDRSGLKVAMKASSADNTLSSVVAECLSIEAVDIDLADLWHTADGEALVVGAAQQKPAFVQLADEGAHAQHATNGFEARNRTRTAEWLNYTLKSRGSTLSVSSMKDWWLSGAQSR